MSRTTLAAALLVSLALASSAQAQFSLSLGNGSGKSFNLAIGGGQPVGFGHHGQVHQVGGWTPVGLRQHGFRGPRRGRQVVLGGGVQPIGFVGTGWQPATPVSRVLRGSNGQTVVLGMPTGGGALSQPSFGGSSTITHVRRDHTGTHTTTRTVHANGTTSVQHTAVGVPVQAFALAP